VKVGFRRHSVVKYLSAPWGKMTTLSRGWGPGALELQHT